MTALRELLLTMRCAQAALCVYFCQSAVDRAKHQLALALDAQDRARADWQHFTHEQHQPSVPRYLRQS